MRERTFICDTFPMNNLGFFNEMKKINLYTSYSITSNKMKKYTNGDLEK